MASKTASESISKQARQSLRVTNGQIALRLVSTGEGFTQKVEASADGELLLEAGGQDIGLNAGGKTLWLSYEHARVVDMGKDHARLHARISRPEFEITTIFDLLPDGTIDVATTLAARTNTPISALEHRYAFRPSHEAQESANGRTWDYLWMPNLKRRRSNVIGQHVYRSPCLIIQKGTVLASIIPQVDLITPDAPLPAAMDFERPGVLRCGLVAHRAEGHFYYQRQDRRAITLRPGQSLRFGFTIVATKDVQRELGWQHVLRVLWARYGRRYENQLKPQMLYFDDYARYAYDCFFERYSVWRKFGLDNRPVGGIPARISRPRLAIRGTPPPAAYRRKVLLQYLSTSALPLQLKVPFLLDAMRDRSNGLFFGVRSNNLRTAFGLAHYGRKWGEKRLTEAADRIKNLILSAPTEAGLFPVAYIGSARHPAWLKGMRGLFVSGDYGLADLTETALWMLAYHEEFDRDPALLKACLALGDALLKVQAPDGSFPAWLSVAANGAIHGEGPLQASATTAAAGRFLARLRHGRRYTDAAERAADFILEKVWPEQAWFDFETFYSCSSKRFSFRDAETGLPPQGTLAISWAADLLAQVYHNSNKERFFKYGRAAMDILLLFQQIWNASFLSYDTFGGFGVMNTDAEWSDARQALFVPLLLDYYELTGAMEYLERAVAALRASFVLMHAPENRHVAPGNQVGVSELDYGATPDNYGHGAVDRRIGGPIHPDWGSGSACTAAAIMERRYGNLFVDAAKGKAIGINGCRIVSLRVSVRVIDLVIERLPYLEEPSHRTPLGRDIARGTLIKCVNLPTAEMSLWVNNNDLGPHSAEEFAAGVIYHTPPVEL